MDSPRALQRSRRSQVAAGAALIVIGIVALALQYLEGPGRAVILLLAGGSFVAAYLYSDIYGLLIPGGVLTGLGLGSLGEWREVAARDPNAVGLGIGFIAIYVVERLYRLDELLELRRTMLRYARSFPPGDCSPSAPVGQNGVIEQERELSSS